MVKMKKVLKGSETTLPGEVMCNGDTAGNNQMPSPAQEQSPSHDDSEYFEFELLRGLIKIKSKRVSKNVIFLIVVVLFGILAAYMISKKG